MTESVTTAEDKELLEFEEYKRNKKQAEISAL